MEPVRRPHPGMPRRADPNGGIPEGTVPVNRTPRVPPNGTPYTAPRPQPTVPVSTAVEERTPLSTEGKVLSSAYERVGLPSQFVVYKWQDVSMRRIEPLDHAKLTRGIKHKNISIILDVLSSTANRDARDLCVSDFYSACIWHKANSYPAGSTTVTWNSRYGGRATDKVKKIALEEKRLERTRAEYLAWTERGMACPTMRDLELLETLQDEDINTLFQRAQFLSVEPLADRIRELRDGGDTAPTVTARVEELNRRGMAFYEAIDEFAQEFADFGVTETVMVTNHAWNVNKAVEFLLNSGDPERVEEADEIQATIARGEVPVPRKEKVPLTFNLWTMFPYV